MIPRSYLALAGFTLFAAFSGGSAFGAGPQALSFVNAPAAAAAANIDTASSSQPAAADDTKIHSAITDHLLALADQHFNAGRDFYFESKLIDARREFDTALDALLNAPESLPDHIRIERRLEEITDLVYRFDVERLGAGQTEDAETFDKAPIDEISHMTFPVDPALAPKLKAELNQTSSAIPLDLSDQVLSYVKFFQTDRGRKILLAGFRRAGRYRDLIQRVFAEEGVPPELIYLAQAESGFLPRAVSYKQAYGMWQFISGTGSLYSLTRTKLVDDRFDPELATRAAARHLKDLYARYGDWYLAMAAYNCGAGAVDRAVERTGYADYWELLKRHALPKETASYVPIIIAITIMAKNPQDYGLENMETDPPVEYDTIHLTAPTNLNLIADASMQPVSEIKDLNPSLLTAMAPLGFDIHVPKGTGQMTEAALNTVPAVNRDAWRLHRVEAGDTLATIAKSYHLTAARIAEVNASASTDSLTTGDVLLIPAVYHPPVVRSVRSSHISRKQSRVAKTRKSIRRGTHMTASIRRASLPE